MHVIVGAPPSRVEEAADVGDEGLGAGMAVGEEDVDEALVGEGDHVDVDGVGYVGQETRADAVGLSRHLG